MTTTNNTLLKQFAKGGGSATGNYDANSKNGGIQNCVIYTRVSSKEQADTNQSLEWQKKYCVDYAVKNSLIIQGFFGGTYESAKSDERKEFNRMLKFVKGSKEKISLILVYSLDRFSRTGDSAIYITSQLKNIGINVLAVTQPIDTNSHAGALQQNIQFIFSKYDNDLRRQKSIDGMREKLLRGERMGPAPIGYKYDRTHGTNEQRLVFNEQGPLVKQAFIWRTEGKTYPEIIHLLKKSGLKLSNQNLTRIFHNPFYCGLISHNFLNGQLVQGKHPALIDEDLFLRANSVKKNITFKVNKANDNLPLKVFVKDAHSQAPFTGYIVKKKGLFYYKVNKIGAKINRSASKMHDKFREFLKKYSITDRFIPPLKKQLQYTWENLTNKDNTADLKKSLSIQLNEVNENLENLEERHALGKINEDIFLKYYNKYLEEKKGLEEQLEKLSQKLSNPNELINFACKMASKLSAVWDYSDYYQKQNLQYLIFPEGIEYDAEKEEYRTSKINSAFALIAYLSGILEKNKSETFQQILEKSRLVPRKRLELSCPYERHPLKMVRLPISPPGPT
jgi:site-specific DNA recombinase